MRLEREKTVQALLSALDHVKNNPALLLLAAFVDALFFLAYGFLTGPFSDRLVEQSIFMTSELSKQWAAGPKTGLLKLLVMDPIKQYTGKLFMYLAVLFVVSYVVYCIFQAITWHIALRMSGHRQTYWRYLLGFARVNLLWFAGYILYRLLDIVIDLRYVLIKRFDSAAINILGGTLSVLFFFLLLLAIASYPSLTQKTLLKSRLRDTLGFILVAFVIILNAQFFTNQLSKLFLLPNISPAATYIMLFALGIFFALFMNLIRLFAVAVYSEEKHLSSRGR